MPRRRKKKREDHHVDESWLLPYADLLTLLFALFVVLFASSTLDESKFNQMSSVFNQIFDSGQGMMDNPAVTIPQDSIFPDNSNDDNEDNTSYLEDQKSLGEIKDSLDEYIAVNELENQFETKLTEEGLLVTIRDSILFSPGKATIREEYKSIAGDLTDLLIFDTPRQIVVGGHTDNVPMYNAEFQSNWELSAIRAVNFLEIIVNNEKVDPLLFSTKAYGDNLPIASNDTAEGRDKNRRVEVLIQPLVLKDGSAFE